MITKKNKILRDWYFRNGDLEDKIYAGHLEYYADEYLILYNRYKQRLKNSKKHISKISKNYAIVNDKNDKYSMKAITSKRLYNKKKILFL